ncbi:hypothetical protein [Gluconacetobacter diazotrophicus]|uniref:hypothetical protein n=1 Tax=Gluconacetobacter diazotrophicus TaxID=33996 RepID=UPI000173B3E1|nr:hypothetical protein [Gluconacetobacter diazotrophicus]
MTTFPSISTVCQKITSGTSVFKYIGGAGQEGRIVDFTNLPITNLPACIVMYGPINAKEPETYNSNYQEVDAVISCYIVSNSQVDLTGMSGSITTYDQCLPDLMLALGNTMLCDSQIIPTYFDGTDLISMSESRLVNRVDWVVRYNLTPPSQFQYPSTSISLTGTFGYNNENTSLNLNGITPATGS